MCRLMPSSATHEISAPRTRVSPLGSASTASAQPPVVSWSVSATTSSPAARALRTNSAGASVPSEAVLWVCRSMRTLTSSAGRIDGPPDLNDRDHRYRRRARPPADGGESPAPKASEVEELRGQHTARKQVQLGRRVAQIGQHDVVVDDVAGRLARTQHDPQPQA